MHGGRDEAEQQIRSRHVEARITNVMHEALLFTSMSRLNKNNSGKYPAILLHKLLIASTSAVKRILQEAKELANDNCTDYTAAPLEVSSITI